MAYKLKINSVKCKLYNGSNTLVVKVRILSDISPDAWETHSGDDNPDVKLYYKAEEDPEIGVDTPIMTPYKVARSMYGKYYYYWFLIEGCQMFLDYHIFASGIGEETGKTYKSHTTIERFTLSGNNNPILMVYGYNGWVDFSDCVPVPEYSVNNTNIEEEWTDGNHNLHSSVIQTRIKGSFSLYFRTKSKLNEFLACKKFNESEYGTGRIRLKVQVNNELDLDDMTTYSQADVDAAQPMMYSDLFKFDWSPNWTLPFFGTTHEYSAVQVNIEEIEE